MILFSFAQPSLAQPYNPHDTKQNNLKSQSTSPTLGNTTTTDKPKTMRVRGAFTTLSCLFGLVLMLSRAEGGESTLLLLTSTIGGTW